MPDFPQATMDEVRQYWDRRQCNVRHSRQPAETRAYRIADYVQYRYVKPWPWSWMSQSAFRWLEKRLGWHLCLTAEAC
jgi:hypothetical protein